MNTQTLLFAGAVLGWLISSIILRRSYLAQVFNIFVGMLGAVITASFIAPLLRVGINKPGTFNFPTLMISLAGAGILLAVVNFFSNENNVRDKVVEHRWEQVSDKISTRWKKLTAEDVLKIDGNYNRFIDTVQVRYGNTRSETEDQIQRYLRAVLVGGSRHSFMYDRVKVKVVNPDA